MKKQTAKEFASEASRVAPLLEAAIPQALKDVEPIILEGINENFLGSQSPDGLAWPERKIAGDGHPLLIDTRALQSAATQQGAIGHVSRVEGNTLVVGVDKSGGIGGIPGAGVHNYGFPPSNIPQREFMGLSEEAEQRAVDAFTEQLVKALD